MVAIRDLINIQTHNGPPVTVGDTTITPQSQALTIRWPNGGFVWNRPLAVLVERGGQHRRVPIFDVTRLAQLGLLTLVTVWVLLILLGSRR